LFIKGLIPFWDGKGKLYDQGEYNAHLTQCQMDHSKFKTLEEDLKGDTLVEHMITNFEILNQFKEVMFGFLFMSYASCIDLEILTKEMTDYDIPSYLQWKEIMRLGKTKCSFSESSR
jgi:hypothetical protein